MYVKKGSTISLTCSVNVHSTPPSSVSWYHGHAVVDFDSPRGGISLETERTEAGTTSKLLVTKALISDSGNYTCMPSNASPASTIVHVLNGESRSPLHLRRCIFHVSALEGSRMIENITFFSVAFVLFRFQLSVLYRMIHYLSQFRTLGDIIGPPG